MATEDNKKQNIPDCVGIILDGNRRWAKGRGLPAFAGHDAGYQNLKHFLGWAKKAGVRHVIAYAFSTENWKRADEEVGMLMKLFERMVIQEAEELKKERVKILFVGQKEKFSTRIQEGMARLEKDTAHFAAQTLAICVSYGGRAEILDAVKRVYAEKSAEEIKNLSEEEFSNCLWTRDIPDPDLIIRTGGEERLSNFLPWQSVYSELFFTETKWPDFSEEEFLQILDAYAARERRRGK